MDQRGRKSSDNLAVVVSIPGQRPDPPEVLGSAERQIWRRVVATKPAEWFGADTAALLSEYCRAWVMADKVDEALAVWEKVPEGEEFQRWVKLCERQDKTARLLKTMASALRLTPQSRYTPQAAATASKKTGALKPWERAGADEG